MMEMIIRGSEYSDFLTCRKKWLYSWVEKITPIRPDNKLWFGTLFHKWLERYYANGCNMLLADLESTLWLNEQDTSGMEQTAYDDQIKLFKGVKDNYLNKYHENDKQWKILGTEVEFLILLEEGTFFTGTIDLVYEDVDGRIRFKDHKCVASLDMYEEKSKMDRQISRYWWALEQIAAGVGRIKVKATREGEKDYWATWNELSGKEISGFTYNLIAKDFPREPVILKSGALSKDKSQKTTYEKYVNKMKELGIPDVGSKDGSYLAILDILKNKQDPFLRRVNVVRTKNELESSIWELLYTTNDIHDVALSIVSHPELVDEVTYRHIGTHCEHMCQFKAICQAAIAGDNVQMVKNLAYKKNEER